MHDLPLFPRYRFSLDDNILFLRDLARSDARSLFEHPYLAFWQRMHREYGTKVHINLYLECPGFHLSQFPARFRGEWQENADWLQLSFHARADKPDKPYLQAPSHQVVADCDAVCNEILRFAGEELLSPFTTIHWAEATREACRALRQRGVRGLVGIFLPDGINDVARWRAERAGDTEGRTCRPRRAEHRLLPDAAQCAYLRGHDYWHDPTEDLFFITHDLVVNSVGTEEVVPFLEDVAADPHRGEVIELIVHEHISARRPASTNQTSPRAARKRSAGLPCRACGRSSTAKASSARRAGATRRARNHEAIPDPWAPDYPGAHAAS